MSYHLTGFLLYDGPEIILLGRWSLTVTHRLTFRVGVESGAA